jgi:ribonuclease P protein component
MSTGTAAPFPRRYRLTKTDEFSSVFGFRRALRGERFLLHYGSGRPAGESARLGLVIGKKFLKRAVGRNLVKRIIREQFRLLRPELPACDVIVRLSVKLAKAECGTRRVRQDMAAEIRRLFGKLRGRLRQAAAPAPADERTSS